MSIELIEPEPVLMQHGLKLRPGPITPSPLGPRPREVVQGYIYACQIAAVMIAMAHARPALVSQILGAPHRDVVLSKRRDDDIFKYWTDFYYDVTFPGRLPTRISPMVYFNDSAVQYASTPGGAGWPSYIEKAYVVWKSRGGQGGSGGDYTRLEPTKSFTPPNLNEVIRDLIGAVEILDLNGKQFFDAKQNARPMTSGDIEAVARRASRRPTVAPTIKTGAEKFGGLVSSHGYAVLGFRNGVRHLNPHGGSGAEKVTSVADFEQAFQGMWQAV